MHFYHRAPFLYANPFGKSKYPPDLLVIFQSFGEAYTFAKKGKLKYLDNQEYIFCFSTYEIIGSNIQFQFQHRDL